MDNHSIERPSWMQLIRGKVNTTLSLDSSATSSFRLLLLAICTKASCMNASRPTGLENGECTRNANLVHQGCASTSNVICGFDVGFANVLVQEDNAPVSIFKTNPSSLESSQWQCAKNGARRLKMVRLSRNWPRGEEVSPRMYPRSKGCLMQCYNSAWDSADTFPPPGYGARPNTCILHLIVVTVGPTRPDTLKVWHKVRLIVDVVNFTPSR